jgi:hypothetical protein
MRKEEFIKWLSSEIKAKPASDCASRCRKVENALGIDLDDEYNKDGGRELLNTRLAYSVADERANKPAPPGFNFKEGSSIRFRMTDLRSATKKYFSFCQRENIS